MRSTVTNVVFDACAIVAQFASAADPDIAEAVGFQRRETARRRDWIAGTTTIGSFSANGLSMTFQSGRAFSRSLPMMPRIGMNGTPFCPAIRPASSAGQVASISAKAPLR